MYYCERCLYNFKRKDYLKKHLQRKFPCKEVHNNNSEILGKSKVSPSINLGKSKVSPSINLGKSKVSPFKNIENIEYDLKLNEIIKESSEEHIEKKYYCEYCYKEYCHKQSKHKHLKQCEIYRNIKEKANNYDKIVKKLEEKNKSLIIVNYNNEQEIKIKSNNKITNKDIVLNKKIKINNHILNSDGNGEFSKDNNNIILNQLNNTNNINNSKNIINNNTIIINHINPFGQENLESITEEKIINILNQSFNSFQETIKAIHKDIPENSNFYLPNKSDRKHISYYNGNHSIYECSRKFKDKLCDKTIKQIEQWYHKYNMKCIKTRRKMLEQVFNEYYDGKLESRYNTEVDKYLLTYSNEIKKLIKNTLK